LALRNFVFVTSLVQCIPIIFNKILNLSEGGDEIDEQSQEDVFEEKLRDAIDGLSQKSAQGRTLCLEGISKALIKRFIPDFVVDR